MNESTQDDLQEGTKSNKCPQCKSKGRLVNTQIVKAMLAISLHAVRPMRYYFCESEGCPVVYFAEESQQWFGEEELRERVYQKHPDDQDILICYCFCHTARSIRDEWQQSGKSTVIETITVGTQTGECACDIRNPQATCCLGNVRQFVQRMMRDKN